ncbi:MAG: hypothetical protein ACR2OI_09565 [Acidimicrobiia bacterium]
MADDLAFLFDDPAPGPAAAASGGARPIPRTADRLAPEIEWKTLRQTHEATSIPISTLRKWAKKGKVRARLERVGDRELRLVAFEDILDRARLLERDIEPLAAETVIDLREPAAPRVESVLPEAELDEPQPASGPDPEERPEPGLPLAAPEGSILVPIDAWDRLLGQLGNLHEAGQQLAEARERAAKAETEAEFLKERLREMRKRAEEAELAFDVQNDARALPEAPAPVEPVLQIGWRRFRSRWLSR